MHGPLLQMPGLQQAHKHKHLCCSFQDTHCATVCASPAWLVELSTENCTFDSAMLLLVQSSHVLLTRVEAMQVGKMQFKVGKPRGT